MKDKHLGLILASIWMIPTFGTNYFLNGMENTLNALIMWCIVYYCLKAVKNKFVEQNDFIYMTLLLILNTWTRYDSVILSTVIFLFIVYISFINFRINSHNNVSYKYLALSILMIIGGALIQFCGFFLMGDSFLPVSAQVKAYLTPSLPLETIFENILNIIAPTRYMFSIKPPVRNLVLSLFFTFIFIIVNSWIIILFLKKKGFQYKEQPILVAILLFSVSTLLYSLVISNLFHTYYSWYLSSSIILWVLILSTLILYTMNNILFHFYNRSFYLKSLKENTIFILLICLIVLYSMFGFIYVNGVFPDGQGVVKKPLHSLRYEVAIWLKENTNEDVIIGSWNAGQLGFFSERRVINLDGRINHISYYKNIIRSNNRYSGTEFVEYLDKMNISYIVDYNFYGFIPEKNYFVKIIEFDDLNLEKPIQVWMRNAESS